MLRLRVLLVLLILLLLLLHLHLVALAFLPLLFGDALLVFPVCCGDLLIGDLREGSKAADQHQCDHRDAQRHNVQKNWTIGCAHGVCSDN